MHPFKKRVQIPLLIVLSLLLSHCGGIRLLSRPQTLAERSHLYSDEFLQKIQKATDLHNSDQWQKALKMLKGMVEKEGRPVEAAQRDNFIGVIYFSQKKYKIAIGYFQKALKTSELDQFLTAKIKLNLGSAYYKVEQSIKAYSILKETDERYFSASERAKYFYLFFFLAKELGDDNDALRGLINFLGAHQTIAGIKDHRHFDFLINNFNRLGRSEKIRFLEDYVEDQNLAAGYLGFIEAKNLLYRGERKDALKLSKWIRNHFSKRSELQALLEDFEGTIEDLSHIETDAVGVVLPFTGSKSEFAKRAMLGIDFGIRKFRGKYQKVKIYTADSKGDPLVAKRKVKELIQKHSVSFIIGGLFSKEAKEEYLEARKYGVAFLSLAPIFLPRKEKSFLLVEIPGSVESQIKRMLEPDIISAFGTKLAVIYPNSEQGKSFIDEVWMQTRGTDIQITSVQSYPRGTKDFRGPVANVLGLKHPRLRQEELDFMQRVSALKKSRARSVQILPPNMDFDWVYIPVYPQEAIQIIPAFSYYDADKLSFLGPPSWRSQIMSKVKKSSIYFIGDGINRMDKRLLNEFIDRYKRRPRLIEINALEAINLAGRFLSLEEEHDRESYNLKMREMRELRGLTGQFQLSKGIW
ncbi:MAG: ABC transporter substrate-binding protein, partial [Bacteriovoracales bacterium]|nr:ABC transporter substrate-binding protein [Bacteriovoracales bacterium]